MGLFGYIGGKIQQAEAEALEAQMEAEGWNAMRICSELQSTSSITKSSGYIKELKSKCQDMSEQELKHIFNNAFTSRNAKACNAMMPLMNKRGLAHKDANGKIVRTYR